MPIVATAQVLTQTGQDPARTPAWPALRRLVSGNHALGWADQAAVSATSFLALIMIGRWTDASELGAYAIGSSVLALLLAAQESLVTRPYSIQLHRPRRNAGEHAFSVLVLSLLLAASGMFVLGVGALTLSAFGAHHELVDVSWAVAGAMPFVLLREFARRFAFAHLKMFRALMLDAAVAAFSVGMLAWLGWSGRLSAVTAFAALGVSCAIAGFGWLYLARREFELRLHQIRPTLMQSWVLGRWLLSGQLALQVQGYLMYWLSLIIAGATVTGIFAACMSIVSFANPLLFGFYNVATPRFVNTLKNEGSAGLRRQAARDTLLLGAVMTSFCLLVLLLGDRAMHVLYAGAEYSGNGHILAVLAAAALAAAVGAPASLALASAERARPVAAVMTFTAVLNVVLLWWLMPAWGLLGAAYAALIAETAGSLGRWTAFLALMPKLAARRSDAVS
jgi:O-antigen/teichoic acid export membrane protein